MKNIFIINCYIDNSKKLDILKKCIDSVKELNIDILLVAHCSIPEYIIKSVNYYIYDFDNKFNELNFYATRFMANQDFHAEFRYKPNNVKGHEWPIIKSIRNALNFSNSLGYDTFICTDGDNIFSKEDTYKILELYQDINENKYDFIGFEQDEVRVETIFFSGKILPMITAIDSFFPKTIEEYNAKFTYRWPYNLELFFKEMLFNGNTKNKIIKESLYNFFQKENKNLSRFGDVNAGIIYEEVKDKYYLYTKSVDEILYDVHIFENNNLIKSHQIYYNIVLVTELSEYNKYLINFYISDGELYKSINVEFNEKTKEEAKMSTILTFFNK